MAMVKILQYGEGNFLRTFVDAYFDHLNKNEGGMYEVNIVKPITFGTLERFEKQNNKYHIILRGMENGEAVENVYGIDALSQVIDPFADDTAYYALAKDFQGYLYGKNVKITPIEFLREERKFNSFEELKKQIEKDIRR